MELGIREECIELLEVIMTKEFRNIFNVSEALLKCKIAGIYFN